jgi:predicted TIM-barrel fold metal-dependent hydrolase
MIIDSHVHIGKTEKTERYFSFDSYLEAMKKYLIDKSIIMPNVSSIIKSRLLNFEFLKKYDELTKLDKNKFYPFLLIDPNDDLTKKEIQDNLNKIKGVKYHPSITTTLCTDKKVYSIFESFPDNFIILVHCGRNWRSHISYILKAASDFKHLNFIAAHMAGNATDLIEEALNLINNSKLDNVFIDISTSKLPWLIERAIQKIGDDKILFASDEPYSDTLVTKYCLSLAIMTKESYDKILYKNILSILGK